MAASRTITPPVVKGLGTSWVDRSTGYWIRRTFLPLVPLVVLAISAAMSVGLIRGLSDGEGTAGLVVVSVAAGAVAAWSATSFWRRVTAVDPPERSATLRWRWSSVGLLGGLAVLVGFVAARFVAGLLAPVIVGFSLGWLASCLRRDYPGERQARAQWQARRQQ